MRQLPVLLALSLTGVVMTAGCTVQAPTTAFGHMTQSGADAGDDNQQQQQETPDMAQAAPLTQPQLDTYSQTSAWTTVPIRGTTSPPNSAVIITAMDGTMTSADVDNGGRFCANLVLQPNRTNQFQIKTHDPVTGQESEPVSISVQQSGEPSQGPQPAQPFNASLGGAGTAYQLGTGGTKAAYQITDGQTSTWYEDTYTISGFSYPAPAFTVRLTQAESINKIVAVTPSDCAMSATLVLAYSAQSTPAPPGDNVQGWVKVPATKGTDGLTWTATFDDLNGVTATYVAAWWEGVTFTSANGCSAQSLWQNFGLAELQAWTTPGATVPPQSAPICGS